MVVLILFNIAIIVYIYFKYYNIPNVYNSTNEEIEKVKQTESIILGYINDQGFENNYDLILAEIIELNIKKYISIEYNDDKFDKYNYIIKLNTDINSDDLNKYEMLILSFLFEIKPEITKTELENKLSNSFESYNFQYNQLKEVLNKKIIEENILDTKKYETLNKYTKKYIVISAIMLIVTFILYLTKMSGVSSLYILIYILEKILSSLLLFNASTYTQIGQKIKYCIDSYKISIQDKEYLTNNITMKDIVNNKEFANSLALHINTEAKSALFNDTIIKNATNKSKKSIIYIIASSVIVLLIGLIISKIIILLPKDAIKWVFIIFTISAACVADIVYSIAKDRTKK